jgi:hypothetical protein
MECGEAEAVTRVFKCAHGLYTPRVTDTIAAISTPRGEGAIALLRMSGSGAIAVADEVFQGKKRPSEMASRVQHFGAIFANGRKLDDVLLSVHRAPASYTGEDVVEIGCHGGLLVTRRILELLLSKGARSAHPGEFTQRAFLNGKLDLTQAEAVMDLITAQTDLAMRAATEQLAGRLGDRIATCASSSSACWHTSRLTSISPMKTSTPRRARLCFRGSMRLVRRSTLFWPRQGRGRSCAKGFGRLSTGRRTSANRAC